MLSDLSAAEQCWREAGATSARAAQSVYTAIYRRRWGCEAALQGARMKLSRGYLVSGVNDGGAPRGGGASDLRPERPRPLRSCRLAGAPRHACWTAELGACTFADRCLPCTMYHVRRPLLDLYQPCPVRYLSLYLSLSLSIYLSADR